MLSGLKFIARDQVDKAHDEQSSDSDTRKGYRKKNKSRHSEHGSERIKKRSKKKWYSSEEDASSSSDSDRKTRRKKKGKSKKPKSRREYSSDDDDDEDTEHKKGVSSPRNDDNIVRKEMGLEWMLRPKEDVGTKSALASSDVLQETETPTKEIKKVNPRELNPYFKNDGSGYPEEEKEGKSNLLSASVVGDGGASWRLKALKRAQEQAAREGKHLDEVVGERWGSLGKLAVSVTSASAAPSHAHLHAIKNRIRQQNRDQQNDTERDNNKDKGKPDHHHSKMRMPRPDDSLSWGKRKSQTMSVNDAGVISSALSSMQKFTNDGNFMKQFKSQQKQKENDDSCSDRDRSLMSDVSKSKEASSSTTEIKPALSANQLAAKAMQLRMKGKHDEADRLLKEAEVHKERSKADTTNITNSQGNETTSRYIMHGLKTREKRKEEDADTHVARSIMQNRKFSISGQADDEYDYDEGPKKKKRGKGDNVAPKSTRFGKGILTQKERCNFCFENPKRPRHLVVAIANFTYLMLPPWQPVVPGHCCILPMQHELATRSVDDNIWDEIRNFKKCLLMMFAKQDKEVVFLETVMGLTKQSRHCMIECIPLPPDVGKQAALYFKKAIDEAEEEWSQHNAKKLIDTSEKGLRRSIPEDFPYFHVEFGLKKGYVHVIDDESQFKSNFGVNVVRGMLRLPAEDMHRRNKYESVDTQREAVANFARDWEPFDWTKQLD